MSECPKTICVKCHVFKKKKMVYRKPVMICLTYDMTVYLFDYRS